MDKLIAKKTPSLGGLAAIEARLLSSRFLVGNLKAAYKNQPKAPLKFFYTKKEHCPFSGQWDMTAPAVRR